MKNEEFCSNVLSMMLFSEEIGNYLALRAQVANFNEQMLVCSDKQVETGYQSLLSRMSEALKYEETHGAGSLLDIESAYVNQLIRDGILPQRLVAAAQARTHCSIKKTLLNARLNNQVAAAS